jgi:hypothetical protein
VRYGSLWPNFWVGVAELLGELFMCSIYLRKTKAIDSLSNEEAGAYLNVSISPYGNVLHLCAMHLCL